jgi:hypothetical protein
VLTTDAIPRETSQRLAAETIVSDAGEQRHISARPSGGDRLVRPLTPRRGLELAAQDGFPRQWNSRYLDDHIGVGTTDYDQLRHGANP